MNEHKKHLDALEALADTGVAVELAEGSPTKQSRTAASRYHRLVTEGLAEMRRLELAKLGAPRIEKRQIRGSLLAMARDALIAELARLHQRHPTLGFSHRKLADVTDDDLRTMIEDIYWSVEHVS